MSYTAGMAAIHLEMPDQVPRTEYSAESHWKLIAKVTGIDVQYDSDPALQQQARREFYRAWDYAMSWGILVHTNYLNGRITRMGHATYADGGTDFSDAVYCPFQTPEEALALDPMEEYGKLDIPQMVADFNTDYQNRCNFYDDLVNMTGIYITCMSGLIEIFGWDMLLLAAGTDPKAFGELTNRYCDWIAQYFEALALSDAPVVMVHDDIVWTEGPFIHPDWYRKYIFPNYKRLFAPLIDSGKKILYTSDGNYTTFIDDIAACGINGFVLEPLTDMAAIAERYGKTHAFVGNADTRILLSGTKEDIYAEVKRCMDIGKQCPGFIMAVGNHIPSNTPVDNALYYNEAFEKLRRR